METVERLKAIIADKGTTTIIYHGGSAPGTARAVQPIAVERGMLVARCLETNARKTFKLAKLEFAGAEPIIPYSDAMAATERLKARSFADWLTEVMPELQATGWHIAQNETSVSLHEFTRHGKPRVRSLIALEYREFWQTTEYDMDADRVVEVTKRSLRPWVVDGRPYGTLAAAFTTFIAGYRALLG